MTNQCFRIAKLGLYRVKTFKQRLRLFEIAFKHLAHHPQRRLYFIRKGKADLETDFDDFKDEFEEEEPAPAERTYTTLPKTKGAEDAAPDPESAACNKGSETADTEAESETAESEEEDAEKESCADREVSPQEESEVTAE